jgi:hypothetical protein
MVLLGAAGGGFSGLGNAKPSPVGNAEAVLGCGAPRRTSPRIGMVRRAEDGLARDGLEDAPEMISRSFGVKRLRSIGLRGGAGAIYAVGFSAEVPWCAVRAAASPWW